MVTIVNRTAWIMKLTDFAHTAMERREFKEIGNNSVLMLLFWPNLQMVILVFILIPMEGKLINVWV